MNQFLKDLCFHSKSQEPKKNLIKIISPLSTSFPLKNLNPPEENGLTYEKNARIKALWLKNLITQNASLFKKKNSSEKIKPFYLKAKKTFFLGEDSGLEIEALKGFPGLFSARFAKSSALNSSELLRKKSAPLKEILNTLISFTGNQRRAYFQSTIVVLDMNGKEMVFKGTLEGKMSEKPKGNKGFGYDGVFIPKGKSNTLSEMGVNKKNKLSHRSKAFSSFLRTLFLN